MTTTFAVTNPVNGTEIAQVPDLTADDARIMIAQAQHAFEAWRQTTGKFRSDLLERWYVAVLDQKEQLARTMTLEQGKPLTEAVNEVAYGAAYIKWFAEEARRIEGEVLSTPDSNKRLWVTREPVGVVGAITPWNFPMAMITRKVAAALAAGCAIVVKPAAETPLTAMLLQQIAVQSGIPAALFSVVTTTDHIAVGKELTSNPTVRKISFTGSTATGKLLMQQSSTTVKRLSLELGGNAPFIVFDDADIDRAISGAIDAKFRNAGQTCVCANRLFIQRGVYDQFLGGLAQQVSCLTVGDGLDPSTRIGPLITAQAVNKVDELVKDAIDAGAQVVIGGQRHPLGANFYMPTVLTGVRPNMRIAQEEIFGPVAAVTVFDTEDEVLGLANDCETGLAAYVYTENFRRIIRMTERLEFGMVGVNEGLISTEVAPFGGVKQSGYGREGSKHGLDDYLSFKYVCLGVAAPSAAPQ